MPRYWGASRVLYLTASNAKRVACVLVAFALLQLLLSLLWKPPLNDIHGRQRPATTWGEPYQQQRSILDRPAERTMEEDCMSLLRDTQRISSSVRQELQVLEDQRRELAKQVDARKALLQELEADVRQWRGRISEAKTELGALRKQKTAILHPSTSRRQDSQCEEQVVILPPVVRSNQTAGLLAATPASPPGPHSSCDMESCFDLHRCSLLQPMSVHLPQVGRRRKSAAHSEIAPLVERVANYLRTRGILADELSQSCLTVVFRTDTDGDVDSWDGVGEDQTANTVVIDWATQTHTGHGTQPPYHVTHNVSHSISVSASFTPHLFRRGYDIVSPPPVYDLPTDYWRHMKPLLPVKRKFLLYFQGVWSDSRSPPPMVSLEQLTTLLKALGSEMNIITECDTFGGIPVGWAGWQLCDGHDQRVSGYSTAIFSLIPAGGISPAVYIRLVEALRWGSIPVIVDKGYPLPYDDIIDWQKSAVVIPMGRFNEIHYILKSFHMDSIMEMKRRCRFLFETYFRSPLHLMEGVLAVMRRRLLQPPPPAPDYTPPVALYSSSTEGRRKERLGWHNFTSFNDLFNLPPGPSHSYPALPTTPELLSGYQFTRLTDEDKPLLPTHIVEGGGVTGPEFSSQLLGNRPEESFTAVVLTYDRFDIVLDVIKRLGGVPYLDKIVVVWNNPADPPAGLQWPQLSVPLKVVRGEGNSLNNRFLPFREIQTEAVLSIDDDILLREEEILMAFRVWRENRDRLVGFPARFHSWDTRHTGWLYNSNYSCEISMVLTGAAFLHKYYFYLYTSWLSKDIHSFVDDKMNCEDIAMNFLVAHITRKPPIKVTTRWTFTCPGCTERLSSDSSHFAERHECVNFFSSVFGYTPLLYTQWRADSVLFKTRLPQGMDKCFPFV